MSCARVAPFVHTLPLRGAPHHVVCWSIRIVCLASASVMVLWLGVCALVCSRVVAGALAPVCDTLYVSVSQQCAGRVGRSVLTVLV